jgi:hypothetical protein
LGLTETMSHFFKVAVDIGGLDREACAGALLLGIEQKSPIAKSILSGIATGLTRSTTPPSLTVIKGDKADPT